MSCPVWTARRIDEDGRRTVSGVWTYQRTLRRSGCAGAWEESGLRRGYHPDPALSPARLQRPGVRNLSATATSTAAFSNGRMCCKYRSFADGMGA